LRVEGTGFGTVGSVSDLRLTLVSSVLATAGTNAGTTSNPQVNRTGLSLANLSNTFYVGSVDALNSPLPITLISFTAIVQDEAIRLDWRTSMEWNNDHFTIQRALDAENWEDIQVIKGAGNTNIESHYTSYDEHPVIGTSYYRLKQTDLDGESTCSLVRSVTVDALAYVDIYPNPASNYLIIEPSVPQELNIEMYDNNGDQVIIRYANNYHAITLDVSGVSSGIYFIQVHLGNSVKRKQILIRH
jgi:hypothetical protein